MRILLSAYACEPGGGSETGKGWRFAEALAGQGCDVTVLTCGSHHRAAIERHGAPPNLRFVWHDVPGWPGPGYERARFIRQHYMAWQATARGRVRRLLEEQAVDVIHHLTWTVLRWPSFLGGLGPRFVFGPVGGGEVVPAALRPGLPPEGRRRERLRDAINLVSRVDPTVRRCLQAADAILVTDAATAAHVPRPLRGKVEVVADIHAPDLAPPTGRAPGADLLFAGRLEYWKGAHLAIGALAALLPTRPDARLTIAGAGPEEARLRAQARGLPVTFAGRVAHDAMPALHAAHDVFLFPSLHDSGPTVIGEALSHGVPVVCLDLGGPGIAVDASCGAVVSARTRDTAALQAALAEAVAGVLRDPRLREGARARAQRFTPAARAREMMRIYGGPSALPLAAE